MLKRRYKRCGSYVDFFSFSNLRSISWTKPNLSCIQIDDSCDDFLYFFLLLSSFLFPFSLGLLCRDNGHGRCWWWVLFFISSLFKDIR